MEIVEKNGADWYWSERKGELLYETYDEDLDLIGAVHKDRYGFYIAALYKKLKDPGLANPAWACERPEGKFDNYVDAVTHVKALLINRRND